MIDSSMLAAVAARYGVTAEQVTPVAGGVASHAYRLGEELFLRIARPEPAFVADLRKEGQVIPVARAAGVHTPRLVDMDDTGALIPVPYLVLERVPGADLAQLDPPPGAAEGALRELGRQLARLHRVTRTAAGHLPGVAVDEGDDPRRRVGRLAGQGYLDVETGRWLVGWFDRLAVHRPDDPGVVLLHGDVARQNIMVEPATGRFHAVVDWGDACWADPAMELAKLSLFDVVAVLRGYREEVAGVAGGTAAGGTAGDGGWEARVLWYHLSWALARIADPTPRPGQRHWTAPPASRLLGLLRFFASSPPAPWSTLG